MNRMEDVAWGLIGCGRLGCSMAAALGGLDQVSSLLLFDQSSEAAFKAAQISVRGQAVESMQALTNAADWIGFATPDDALPDLVAQCSAMELDWKYKTVLHFSGAHSSDVLRALSKRGARIASLHPLQTFSSADKVVLLQKTWCAIESHDPEAQAELEGWASRLGMHPFHVHAKDKMLYHVAACLACNYMTALLDASVELMRGAALEPQDALQALRPLLEQTLINNMEQGPEHSLSGPIARGDSILMHEHIAALKTQAPDMSPIYCVLGRRAADLALRIKAIDAEQHKAMLTELSES